MAKVKKPEAIVLDIDGTTSSVRFLTETVFPYIQRNLREFLNEKWGDEALMAVVSGIRRMTRKDIDGGEKIPAIAPSSESKETIVASLVTSVLYQIEIRKNNKPLKELQILMWINGYETGRIKGHVFTDVPDAFHKWKKVDGISLYIYSTGSVDIQKLLFSCSVYGNLMPLITDFFDHEHGKKTDTKSFVRLARKIDTNPNRILFLTDNPKEAAAASRADCMAILVIRPGNKPLGQNDFDTYPVVSSFMDIEWN